MSENQSENVPIMQVSNDGNSNNVKDNNNGNNNVKDNGSNSPLRRSRQQFRKGSSQLSLQVTSNQEPDSPVSTRENNSTSSSLAPTKSDSNQNPSNPSNDTTSDPPSPSIEREKRRHTITVAVSPQFYRKPSSTSLTPNFSNPSSPSPSSPSTNPSSDPATSSTPDPQPATKSLRVKSGVFAIQGRRKHMEDAHTIFNSADSNANSSNNNNNNNNSGSKSNEEGTQPDSERISSSIASDFPEDTAPLSFFGVFDGHGGKKASAFAAQHVHLYTLTSKHFNSNPTLAIQESFTRVEKEFLQVAEKDTLSDGTTALTAFILGNKMYVGCVGDSEGVLCRKGEAFPLNEPHNPSKNEKEAQRVKQAGGRIVHGRVAHPMLNPNLFSIAVSRAIGDVVFKGRQFVGEGKCSGLIADVEVKEVDLKEGEDEFFILACDGLWDVMTHEEAVAFVKEKLGEEEKKAGGEMEEDGDEEEEER